MIDEIIIRESVNRLIADTDLFVVELKLTPDNAIELVLDSDSNVSVNDCARVNCELCEELEKAGIDDFGLTVFSAGLTEPLKLKRQYIKNIGREMEITLASGKKIKAVMTAVNDDSIELEYSAKEPATNGKGKTKITRKETITLNELKSIRQTVKFK
ncbi:MAG: ribosome assembly cofactor RimP [Prevotellaceae bacterium]|jgi:ribosome maturation factor RimP|nr:ribosome assembly cofactor RimP [Prevotellaceae bacterium]